MLGEVTHLQSILEDLCHLTVDPSALPPASEQVIPQLSQTLHLLSLCRYRSVYRYCNSLSRSIPLSPFLPTGYS